MDVNKNSYTFMFAAAMVVVVAAILSFAATNLKPLQKQNVEMEKMQSILRSIEVEGTREESAEAYPEYVTSELVIQNNELIEGVDAFNIDLAKQIRKPISERQAPLYIAEKNGETFYVIPLRGTGLWGPIWGYISLQNNLSTIYGAVFDHQAETPGLGAEINTESFQDQFKGKEILNDDGTLVGIDVVKGEASGESEVDGISGGTITSDGVEAMIANNLQAYIPFLKEYTGYSGSTATAVQPDNN
ncbi:NADH:ubiquinone reductase (Na(+)-transporting) subunit C [Gracilimonas sp. Q87]|uniref:NADH:ubiquinone reductase (Na(+)-transporting) subunit C n=1 Tax=Gracilimonas sp. Q87 TaxID=3384766 RepID=UPI00398459CC